MQSRSMTDQREGEKTKGVRERLVVCIVRIFLQRAETASKL
jgi:hypothetical protein